MECESNYEYHPFTLLFSEAKENGGMADEAEANAAFYYYYDDTSIQAARRGKRGEIIIFQHSTSTSTFLFRILLTHNTI